MPIYAHQRGLLVGLNVLRPQLPCEGVRGGVGEGGVHVAAGGDHDAQVLVQKVLWRLLEFPSW